MNQREKRIAYVLAEFPSLTETFVAREIEALERQGFSITILALKRGMLSTDLERRKEADGTLVYRFRPVSVRGFAACLRILSRHPVRVMRFWIEFMRTCGRDLRHVLVTLYNMPTAAGYCRIVERRRIRHVHAHFASLPGTLGWLVSRLSGVPFSLTAHARDIYVPDAALGSKLDAASFCVTCTRYNLRVLRKRFPGLPTGKLFHSYHGLEVRSHPVRGRVAEDVPLVLGVGRLIPKKGFDHLVRACVLLRDRGRELRCVIAGEGPERQRLESLVPRQDLGQWIRLPGALLHEEVMSLMDRAAVLVAPSVIASDGDVDGLPNVLLEASAKELPVVASRLSAIPELVEDRCTGLLAPPGDVEALADAIAWVLDHPEGALALAREGRKRVEQCFDADKNVRPLAARFTDIIEAAQREKGVA